MITFLIYVQFLFNGPRPVAPYPITSPIKPSSVFSQKRKKSMCLCFILTIHYVTYLRSVFVFNPVSVTDAVYNISAALIMFFSINNMSRPTLLTHLESIAYSSNGYSSLCCCTFIRPRELDNLTKNNLEYYDFLFIQ